jgi:hypothetical protein
MRPILALLLCVMTGVAFAEPQQIADPTFDTRVERPILSREQPGMLFDEAHHNVHHADTTYRAFAELVRNDGARLAVNRAKFTPGLLARYRILVIAGPLGGSLQDEKQAASPAFTRAEIDAVRGWVRRGGGLFLLTDHEPVASASAGLVAALGVLPGRAAVLDPAHRLENMYPSNILATRDNGLLRTHPVTCRVERVLVFGGQSLAFPAGTAVVGLGASARTENKTRPRGNGQVGAFRFGRGRVIITGDMGMLSAQMVVDGEQKTPWGMNWPGIDNRQLLLNGIRWLAGHDPCRT